MQRELSKMKQPKYPCRNCIYYNACGDKSRTMPCEGRKTKSQKRKGDKQMKELIVLERKNGWYGGYEQLFNTKSSCLFDDIKFYTDKGYTVKCLDKTQEYEFMKGRTTFDEYMEINK